VRAFDTRKETAEQVQSMGAQFITVDLEEDGSTETGYSKEMSEAYIKAELALFKNKLKKLILLSLLLKYLVKKLLNYYLKIM